MQMNCENVNKSMYVTNPCTHEFKQVPKKYSTLIHYTDQFIYTNYLSTKIPLVKKNPSQRYLASHMINKILII